MQFLITDIFTDGHYVFVYEVAGYGLEIRVHIPL